MDNFLDRVKNLFGQVRQSESVKTTGASVRKAAVSLGSSAQGLAKQAAGKAQATAAGPGSRAKEASPDAPSTGNPADYAAAEIDVSPVSSTVPTSSPDASGLTESAQATIDQSRQRATELIRDASVPLDTAPDDTPADMVDVVSDVEPAPQISDADDAARRAKTDTYQE